MLLNANDPDLINNVNLVTKRFGGSFFIINNVNAINEINKWKKDGGKICHLSMYGINLPSVINDIKEETNLMIIVGAEKVPIEYYKLANWNIAIGNQPHSEVAALAIFLDRYYNSDPLLKQFEAAELTIIPTKLWKVILKKNKDIY